MNKLSVLVAGLTLAVSAGYAQPASAATVSKALIQDVSSACQISIPTLTTKTQPRATGFRNDGTETTYLICGGAWVNGGAGSWFKDVTIRIATTDGTAASVQCTGVTRQSSGSGPQYVVKTLSIAAGTAGSNATSATWNEATDFGGAGGFPVSVTCALPPKAVVTHFVVTYDDDVGT